MTKRNHGTRTPKEIREGLGLGLTEAARGAGVAPAALARIESGGHGVTVTTLDRVAAFYGLRFGDLALAIEASRRRGARTKGAA